MSNADTLPEPEFVAYTNRPVGSTTTELGFVPAANGEPGTGVKAPVAPSIWYPEILPEPVPPHPPPCPQFATYKNCPDGSTFTEWGADPAANGEPGTIVSAPLFALMVSAETPSVPKPAT